MKNILPLLLLACLAQSATAQINIVAGDVPASGDTLRWSADASAALTIGTGATGPSQVWDYSSLQASAQGLDEYRTALEVNILYAAISFDAYGYKVGDSLPGVGSFLPITVSDVYSFFEKKTNPSRYLQSAFAAKISGFPTPANYSDDDELYFFPLAYGDADTSTYAITIGLPGVGSVKLVGTRATEADGWGTIITPFFTAPVNALRVRSEVSEVDSVTFGGNTFGIPRRAVEYRWLTKESHYPALIISANIIAGNELPSGVRYRDEYRNLAVRQVAGTKATSLTIAPNPAHGEVVQLSVPAHWSGGYRVEVYDATGKLAIEQSGNAEIRTDSLPAGRYLVRAWAGSEVGFTSFVK